ncbi:hypothetical protein KFL_010080010 [Klebsormidium nitens]|uniref:Uncharacterized protein n=1 Tax=Klebsormidium nitens TaxID=105231 RepID=A0A1Y1INT1_KLENI|nr:hypothetical protein KFL_010080010 [Klebsormidium nitens]|eukprot:GAQ92404.1 hypothetical protein KFL_010080010 [Klebsormidium nitens]
MAIAAGSGHQARVARDLRPQRETRGGLTKEVLQDAGDAEAEEHEDLPPMSLSLTSPQYEAFRKECLTRRPYDPADRRLGTALDSLDPWSRTHYIHDPALKPKFWRRAEQYKKGHIIGSYVCLANRRVPAGKNKLKSMAKVDKVIVALDRHHWRMQNKQQMDRCLAWIEELNVLEEIIGAAADDSDSSINVKELADFYKAYKAIAKAADDTTQSQPAVVQNATAAINPQAAAQETAASDGEGQEANTQDNTAPDNASPDLSGAGADPADDAAEDQTAGLNDSPTGPRQRSTSPVLPNPAQNLAADTAPAQASLSPAAQALAHEASVQLQDNQTPDLHAPAPGAQPVLVTQTPATPAPAQNQDQPVVTTTPPAQARTTSVQPASQALANQPPNQADPAEPRAILPPRRPGPDTRMRPQDTAATTELPKRKKKNRPDPGPDTLRGPWQPAPAVPSPLCEAFPQPAPTPLRRERKRDQAQPPHAPQKQSPPPVTAAEAMNERRKRKNARRHQRLTTEDARGSLPRKKSKSGHSVRTPPGPDPAAQAAREGRTGRPPDPEEAAATWTCEDYRAGRHGPRRGPCRPPAAGARGPREVRQRRQRQ